MQAQVDPAALGDPAVLDAFHPLVAAWFRERFGAPTAPQAGGWPRIAAGDDVLIAAPTGSGKTLAAFLACVDQLVREGLASSAPLPDRVQIVYVSPLKALSNDVLRNLETPLAELAVVAARAGVKLPEIRVAVRTGDTPEAERARLAKKPPHILVTTPESLYILLTTERGRTALGSVRTVIVDEIHAVAPTKRGAHLALSLERLERLVTQGGHRRPVRVGLSATQRPIELIGRLLVGADRPLPFIVDGGHRRALDLAIEITDDELGAVASLEQLERVYDHIALQVRAHRSTLVFVNTRRMVERVAAALEARLGEDAVVAHHGSMARERRLAAEQRLKHGEVACAVATASLELGIDVGTVDLVVQLGSPRSIATLLQRVGRSGHHLGGTPKGRLYALTRDQLIECAALVRGVRGGNLDVLELRDAPLDVLAQQIVAILAAEGEAGLGEDELFAMVRRAATYAELTPHRFEQILTLLDEGASERRSRLGAYVHRDRVAGRLRARRGARLAAITCGGAIPDNANYAVVLWPEEQRVGEVDEDFAIDSSAGDIFQLGNTAWRIRRIENGRVLVEDAQGAPPTIPFWFGEAPARTAELSDEVSALRAAVEARLVAGEAPEVMARWLAEATSMSRRAAEQTVAYLAAGRAALGAMPSKDVLVAERFFDEAGGMQLVIHAPLGGRINRAWGLALRKRFCKSFDFELQAAATDDGIVISLGQPHSFALDTVFGFLPSVQAEDTLVQALLDAPMFEVRWRWNATRSLAVLRRMGGKKVAPHLVRMRSADLLSVVFPGAQACQENIVGPREVPDHPLVFETVRDCLVEVMDVAGLTALMGRLERGELQIVARDTVEPSVLSHELLSANPYAFLDDAPLEERRTRAITLRRGLGAEVAAVAEVSTALDAAAIAAAEDEVTPEVRDADELHDALLALWLVPAARGRALAPEAERWMTYLAAAGRACEIKIEHGAGTGTGTGEAPRRLWCAVDRLGATRAALDAAKATYVLEPPLEVPAWAPAPAEPETAVLRIVSGQLDHRAPITAPALAAELGLRADQVVAACLALEGDGAILRGQFGGGTATPTTVRAALEAETDAGTLATVQWCNRRILARIHRLTLVRLRREIEPVSAAAMMRFLLRWQRLTRGAQVLGADGLGTVIEQLQGWQTAAGAWEREVLPARLHGYDPAWLDQLCLGGELTWCRLTPRQRDADEEPGRARSAPSRAAPLAILRRADAPWLRAPVEDATGDDPPLSAEATAVAAVLAARGASFLADLTAEAALPADVISDALWELVAAGRATADGFASLRVLVDRKRGETRSVFDAPADTSGADPIEAPRKWLDAVKRARARDHVRPRHAVRALPTAGGRWSLLTPPPPAGADVAERWARQLLARYGVVFRDLVQREAALPPWRDLAIALRRLEARGEIRGGRFVAGFVGEQFALPDAVEGLRAARAAPATAEVVRVAATDPLNLVGVLGGGPRVPAVVGNALLYVDGVVVASREAGVVVRRATLPPGAHVDDDLAYTAPPRAPLRAEAPQIGLAL